VKAWKVFASGDDLGVYVLPAHTLRGMQRTSPSTAFLLPSKLFWDEKEVLVSCPGKGNYTIRDFKRFFEDMNFPEGYEMRKDTEHLLGDFEPPGVEIHCLHGQGVSTVERYTLL
jgi:lysophospholipase-3